MTKKWISDVRRISVFNRMCGAKGLCILLLSVLMAGALSGCVSVSFGPGGVAGQGDMVKRSYDVGNFSSVEIKDMNMAGIAMGVNMDIGTGIELVYRRSGLENKVEIEMQENLFEYIQVSVKGDKLVLESSKNIRVGAGSRPIVYVTMPVFKGLTIRGMLVFKDADKITGEGFDLDVSGACDLDLELEIGSLKMDVSGAGAFKLKGTAQRADLRLSGAGDVNALGLDTVDTDVSISGAGECSISCSGSLKIDLSGIGALKYRGSPEITKNVSGIGSVQKVD